MQQYINFGCWVGSQVSELRMGRWGPNGTGKLFSGNHGRPILKLSQSPLFLPIWSSSPPSVYLLIMSTCFIHHIPSPSHTLSAPSIFTILQHYAAYTLYIRAFHPRKKNSFLNYRGKR